MILVYSCWTLPEAYIVKNRLEAEGIPAIVQNENLNSVLGEIPITYQTTPQVWIVNEDDLERAEEILSQSVAMEDEELEDEEKESAESGFSGENE